MKKDHKDIVCRNTLSFMLLFIHQINIPSHDSSKIVNFACLNIILNVGLLRLFDCIKEKRDLIPFQREHFEKDYFETNNISDEDIKSFKISEPNNIENDIIEHRENDQYFATDQKYFVYRNWFYYKKIIESCFEKNVIQKNMFKGENIDLSGDQLMRLFEDKQLFKYQSDENVFKHVLLFFNTFFHTTRQSFSFKRISFESTSETMVHLLNCLNVADFMVDYLVMNDENKNLVTNLKFITKKITKRLNVLYYSGFDKLDESNKQFEFSLFTQEENKNE